MILNNPAGDCAKKGISGYFCPTSTLKNTALNTTQASADLEHALKRLDWEREPRNLYDPIAYLLGIGGKRMRPLLALFGCELFSGSYQAALMPSLAVEVFHNFTLMHDDIMDKAPLRRGHATVHERWNPNIAILSGDAMMVEAYQLLLLAPPALLPKLLALFNRCALQVCEGQQFDMDFEREAMVGKDQYLRMIELKTAVLLGLSLEMGALLGGAPDGPAAELRQFGISIGIGFQLKDDLLDVYGEQAKVGKQVGGDILANKKTYLLLHALETASGSTAEELRRWLQAETFDPAEKVAAVKAIYDRLGVREAAETAMSAYFAQGFEALDRIDLPAERKRPLRQFAEWLVGREH
jgi:geranylgeranyl diphosphate synthase type II